MYNRTDAFGVKKIFLSLSVIALCSSALVADDIAFSEYSIAVKAGSIGGGLEVTTPILESLNLRVGLTGFNYSTNKKEQDIEYDMKLDLLMFNLMADYYPFESSQFRLSGGAMYNNNTLKMTGKPSAAGFEINGVTYTSADVSNIDAEVDFNKFAPYLGIGWGDAVKKAGWNFTTDLGVMFQGAPNSDVTTTTTLTGAAKVQLDANVAAEKTKLDNDLGAFQYYPVFTVGVSYRF
ncbi:MAG: hypothetical protein GQ570_04820 [Helicobacteraceae bacterium]|nr:hypothetical protein [Helicobacteraceae bacterium]